MTIRETKRDYIENNVQEQEPFELAKEMMTANWSKANTMSIIIFLVVFTAAALLGVVDGNQCGLITAFLPVDAVCAGIILMIPLLFLAMEKLNLKGALVSTYHTFMLMGTLFLHKNFVTTSYFQWFGAFIVVEAICLFSFSKLAGTVLLTIFSESLIMTVFLLIIRQIQYVNRSANILYTTQLTTLIATIMAAAVVAVLIRLWLRKRPYRRERTDMNG